MKRIQSACLLQTIKFEQKDELDAYKATMEKKKTKYVIENERTQEDGSIIIKLKKQYIFYDTGDYLL